MKFSVQVLVHPDDDTEAAPVVREVLAFDRDDLAADTLGLQLAEAKDLLAAVQDTLAGQQVTAAVTKQVACPHCGRARRHKDTRTIGVRSLVRHAAAGQPPLVALRLPRPAHPDLPAAGRAAARADHPGAGLLAGPLRRPGLLRHHRGPARRAAAAGPAPAPGRRTPRSPPVADRLEDELGEEQLSFIGTCQADREALPRPDLPIVVGLDGGYVHSAAQTSRTDGWFEVIAGKAIPADGRPACFGYVQTYDTKPKRRLFEVLNAQGMQANQQVTFLTDGGEDIRDMPCYLNAQAEHLLDWFHLTMRITVMANMAKSCRRPRRTRSTRTGPADLAGEVAAQLQRLKWFCWHGNVFRALTIVEDLAGLDTAEVLPPAQARMLKAVRESDSYIRANADRIPNYGERHRAGEAISTAFTESVVNQVIAKRMVKKQQMRWTPRGAHLLLQVRTRVLNDQLASDFHRWYPGLSQAPDPCRSPRKRL